MISNKQKNNNTTTNSKLNTCKYEGNLNVRHISRCNNNSSVVGSELFVAYKEDDVCPSLSISILSLISGNSYHRIRRKSIGKCVLCNKMTYIIKAR